MLQDVVQNAHRLQRIAGALYNLVQFPDGAAASTPHGGSAQRHGGFRDVQSPPSTPRVGEGELDAPMEAADLATSRRGSPGRPVTFASPPPPPPPPPHNDARMDAVRAVASQLVQELTREVSGQVRALWCERLAWLPWLTRMCARRIALSRPPTTRHPLPRP